MRWAIFALAAGALFTLASPCEAALSLRITQGATIVTVADGNNDGAVGYDSLVSGAVGTYAVVVSTGLSQPIEPAPYPHLHLNITANGTGTLVVELTETSDGSTFISPLSGLILSVGGLTAPGGSITFESFVDDNDVAFGTTTAGPTLGPFVTSPHAGLISGSFASVTDPYSVTLRITIVHSTQGTTSTDADLSTVPEPASLAVWSVLGLAGLGYGGWRRKRVAAK
jgi:hypothetical protein